ncbi:conserved fungal protein [Moniliophthora roreri MCA 2997]|uniref:Conserved fungal protein n=1 Tax=Moniliophthora roreri (strain MCA 2997) TaxID=1381753 RepID=V2XCS2_MONRO|nr:conserved fungal protein [Moniliophthora roreri MCA 2997]
MAPQKRTRNSSARLKQTTLIDHVQSSPPSTRKKSHYSSVSLKKRTHAQASESSDDSSDIAAIKFQPIGAAADDEDEETPSVKRRRITRAVSDSDSSVVITAVRRKGKPSVPPEKKVNTTSDSEEEDIKPRKRRKLVKGKRPAHEEESSDDDLEPEQPDILDSRLRTRGKKTEFQKNLERLRRKKQGKPMETSGSEQEDEGEEEEDSNDNMKPFKGAKPHKHGESDNENGDEAGDEDEVGSDDFIVEDDGETASLPAVFSMESHQDLSHQFKKIFQFLVHIATRSPEDRHDFMLNQIEDEEYFSVPLQVMRRKLLGLRDSLVASSVWRPRFKKALDARPVIELVHMDYAVPGCDACHLGSRMSTYSARVSGSPYDKLGYEKSKPASSGRSDDSDNDNGEEEDERKTIEFNLGRFCARRAKVYHDLTHWEYNLFQAINDEVSSLQASAGRKKNKFVRVAFAGGKKPPEDLSDADAICEWLDERKVIDIEWQKLKGFMDSSRKLEVAVKKGDDMD